MPVKRKDVTLWPNSRIPYEADAMANSLQASIDAFNQQVGFPLFRPRTNEQHYAKFVISTSQGHSAMGCKGTGGQQICTFSVQDMHTTLHEMGHCAGLGHEHFHSQFPKDEAIQKAWMHNMKTSKPEYNLEFLKELCTREIQQCAKYDDVGPFDPRSIMMYGEWIKAYASVNPGAAEGAGAARLSSEDVNAIKRLYPAPIPAPPRPFNVTVRGNMTTLPLALKYEVRSAMNPTRVSKGSTDPRGMATVQGFNPEQAEIRFESKSDWMPVRLRQTFPLQDPRYNYTCD